MARAQSWKPAFSSGGASAAWISEVLPPPTGVQQEDALPEQLVHDAPRLPVAAVQGLAPAERARPDVGVVAGRVAVAPDRRSAPHPLGELVEELAAAAQ